MKKKEKMTLDKLATIVKKGVEKTDNLELVVKKGFEKADNLELVVKKGFERVDNLELVVKKGFEEMDAFTRVVKREFDDIRKTMATKDDLAEAVSDLKTEIDITNQRSVNLSHIVNVEHENRIGSLEDRMVIVGTKLKIKA